MSLLKGSNQDLSLPLGCCSPEVELQTFVVTKLPGRQGSAMPVWGSEPRLLASGCMLQSLCLCCLVSNSRSQKESRQGVEGERKKFYLVWDWWADTSRTRVPVWKSYLLGVGKDGQMLCDIPNILDPPSGTPSLLTILFVLLRAAFLLGSLSILPEAICIHSFLWLFIWSLPFLSFSIYKVS